MTALILIFTYFALEIAYCKSIEYDRFWTKYYTSNIFSSTTSKTGYLPEPSASFDTAPFVVNSGAAIAGLNDINILNTQTYSYCWLSVNTYGNTSYRIYYSISNTYTYWTSIRLSFLAFDNTYVGFNVYYQDYYYYSGSISIYGNYSGVSLNTNDKAVHFLYSLILSDWSNQATMKSILNSDTGTISYTVESIGAYYLYVRHNILVIRSDLLKQYFNVVVDIGSISGTSGKVSQISLNSKYIKEDFMLALNGLAFQKSTIKFTIDNTGKLSLDSGTFDFVNASYINVRVIICQDITPYKIVSNNTCVSSCPQMFYLNEAQQICQSCFYTCATCVDNTNCVTCNINHYRTISGFQCLCNSGYFDNGVSICVSCISNCLRCSNNVQCLQCTSLTGTYSYFGESFQVNYILSSTQTCSLCSTSMPLCINCTSYNICTKCVNENFTISTLKNSCICNNAAGYWANGSNCTLCTQLIPGCLTCSSGTVCSICDISKKLVLSGGVCVCATGYVMKNGMCCHYSCSTCSQFQQCSTCGISSQRTLFQKKCICNNKFFDNGLQICQSCMNVCATCSEANSCITCANPTNWTLVSNQCVCNNALGYWQNNDNCILCKQLNLGCLTCISNSTCTSCDTSKKFTLIGGQCVCQTGYILKNQMCCHYSCSDCQTEDLCSSCSSISQRTLISKKCPCNNKFFDNGVQICPQCMTLCATCDSDSTCLTCEDTTNRTLINNQCACHNIAGYWQNASDCILCKDLILGCITCTSSTICNTCDASKKFVLSGTKCVCATGYNLKNNMCCHYSCLNCEAQDLCLTCNTTSLRQLNNKKCPCDNKYFDNGIQMCQPCMDLCQTCQKANTCKTCVTLNNLTLINSQCVCMDDYVLITNYCRYCSQLIHNCILCNHKTSCKTCFSPNYTLSLDTTACECSQQYFYVLNSNCHHCKDLIYACANCESQSRCLTCISNFTTSPDSTSCICDSDNNFYPIGIYCPHCFDLIVGCQICSANNTCGKCFDTNYTMGNLNQTCECYEQKQYFPLNGQCPYCRDIIIGCTDCDNNETCIVCDTDGFFRLQNKHCVCIDGYYLNKTVCLKCEVSCLTCVDTATFCLTCNNTALRFFEDNKCICRQYFSDCRDSGLQTCDNRTCSFLNQVEMSIISMVKSLTSNILSYKIRIHPALIQFDNFNFKQLFDIGLPPETKIQYSYLNGIVAAEVEYFSNMQGNRTNITYNINQTGYWYFQLAPQSITSYMISPTNNLASNNYPQSIYDQKATLELIIKITMYGGLIIYILGLFCNKIVASQMIAVIQISYIGLFIINFGDPIVIALNNLSLSNGFNTALNSKQQNLSSRIYITGYTSSTITNLNIMMFLLLIPPILSIIFYTIHKYSTKYRIKMQKYSKQAMGEGLITVVLFVLYNYSCSLVTIMYSDITQTQFYVSVLQLLLISAIFGVSLWLFFTKDKTWIGEYKNCFNWNNFSQLYYLFPLFQRFVIGILITAGNSTFASEIIAILIIITGVIILAWKKPFIHGFQNFRSILMNIYSILILGLYVTLSIYGPSSGITIFTYFPYIIFGIVVLNIATGFVFIIVHFILNFKNSKSNQINDIQQKIDAQFKLDMNRNFQKMMKQAKSNNINSKLLKGSKKIKISNVPYYKASSPNKYELIKTEIDKTSDKQDEEF